MASFNKVILIGNLTRDPQLKYLPGSQTGNVVEFGMAVNHKFRTKTGEEREEVCFIECTCFGKGGEIINQYCQKGKQILVEGRLKYDTWEDKQGGGKRSKHTVVVDNFQLMGGRDGARRRWWRRRCWQQHRRRAAGTLRGRAPRPKSIAHLSRRASTRRAPRPQARTRRSGQAPGRAAFR